MKKRHQRLFVILGALAVLGVIAALVLSALNSNLSFFHAPSEVAAGKAPKGRLFRVGGLVKVGSFAREPDGVTSRFILTDASAELTVRYKGVLPDLFSEGKGAVAQGKLAEDGVFTAQEVLAKHDENYMPPEAAAALQKSHAEGVRELRAGEAAAVSAP
ncbi:MAG: cytochrome c maturation protein CcmE [Zoogloeaceae bacterium]|nr:cytochrome c maturation protein CcmE [Zoogloeaceae bacterium]